MPVRLIFREVGHLGAESRFFLQARLCLGEAVLGAPYKIKEAAKSHCLTERFVREASAELVEAGLLAARKSTEGVGRPGVEYLATKALFDVLAKPGGSECVHQDSILRLFTEPDIYAIGEDAKESEADQAVKPARTATRKDGRPSAPGAKGRLGAATRILLAALLSEADECGAVMGLGESKLRSMTGLNAISLKHQLKRLMSLGFVRSYMPGLSNGIFVGSKVTSIYYLNLDHPQLCTKQGARGLVVYVAQGPGKFDTLATGVPSTAALETLGREALEMLYHKLASYTSQLLLVAWANPETELAETKAAIAKSIADELGALWIGRPTPDEGYYWHGMQDNFHAAVCEWAERLRRRLLRKKIWQGYRPQRVRLIPGANRKDNLRVTILVVYPAPRSRATCLVVRDWYKGTIDFYAREADLGVAQRYEVGLLSKTT